MENQENNGKANEEWNRAFCACNILWSWFDVNGYPPTIIHILQRHPPERLGWMMELEQGNELRTTRRNS
jgi:hypothetical protein